MLVHSGIQSRQSSLRFLFAALFIAPILQVGFYVKVDEQSHHNEGVKHHDPFRPSWIFTTVVQQGKKARHYDHGELRLKIRMRQTGHHYTKLIAHISIEITTANQNKGKYHKGTMKAPDWPSV